MIWIRNSASSRNRVSYTLLLHVKGIHVVRRQAKQAAVEEQAGGKGAGGRRTERRGMEDKDVLVLPRYPGHREGAEGAEIDVGVRRDRLVDPQAVHILVRSGR